MKGPYLRSNNDTNKIMKNLLISLVPIILFSIYKNGYIPYSKGYVNVLYIFKPLLFIFASSLTTYVLEIIFTIFLDREKLKNVIYNSYGYIPGLLLSMILPINTPISILLIGCIFATIIGKMVYGGFGNNIFNPALIGYIIIVTCYATTLSQCYLNPYELDAITSSTPLTNLKLVDITYDNVVGKYGNLLDFFIGTIPGSFCETSALFCLLSLLFLAYKKVIKLRIPIIYISTVFVMSLIISLINGYGIWFAFFQIFSGALFFGATFMATDPVTSPVTKKGQILYGLLLGILTVTFRFLTSAPEGVCLAILTMNMLVFIIDKIGINKKHYKISFIILVIISLGLSYYISYSLINDNFDNNYKILEIKKIDNSIIYTVSQKGNGGNIKANITFVNDKITDIEIIENNETQAYYKKITDNNYIEKLINNQNDIENVDTVSGATISSSALKQMVINTIQENGENYE